MGLADQAAILNKAFTLDELEAMDARITAARNGSNVIDAAAVVVPEVQPFHKTQGCSGVAVDQAGSERKPDPAGHWRTGRGTEPGKLPGKHGFVAPTSAPTSWRD